MRRRSSLSLLETPALNRGLRSIANDVGQGPVIARIDVAVWMSPGIKGYVLREVRSSPTGLICGYAQGEQPRLLSRVSTNVTMIRLEGSEEIRDLSPSRGLFRGFIHTPPIDGHKR